MTSRARFLLSSSDVYALPPRLDSTTLQVSGISCPDCGGVLMVQTEGKDATLIFECRIGHTLDVAELLTAKEEVLESHLWAAITVLHELVALLQDVASHGEARGDSEATTRAFRERAARARNTANALRQLVSICRPIDLAPSEAETTGGTMPAEGAS